MNRKKTTPPPAAPSRRKRQRSKAQEELFGNGNPNCEKSPELGREIARIRREYADIEYSFLRVIRG